jgi:hypothetical protein
MKTIARNDRMTLGGLKSKAPVTTNSSGTNSDGKKMTFNLNRSLLPGVFASLLAMHPATYAQPQTQAQPPTALSYEERSRIWLEDLQKRQREKREADEKVLRAVLGKIKLLVEADDFSIETIERTFGLKFEKSQVLDPPKKLVIGPITNYVAVNADSPFNVACPEVNLNLRGNFNPVFWYQTAHYIDSDDEYVALNLFFSYGIWPDVNIEEVAKSELKFPDWQIRYVGPHHVRPIPMWARQTNQRGYGLSILQASDHCGAIRLGRSRKNNSAN